MKTAYTPYRFNTAQAKCRYTSVQPKWWNRWIPVGTNTSKS